MRAVDLVRLAIGGLLLIALIVIGTRVYVDVRDAPPGLDGTLYLRALVQVAIATGVAWGASLVIRAFD